MAKCLLSLFMVVIFSGKALSQAIPDSLPFRNDSTVKMPSAYKTDSMPSGYNNKPEAATPGSENPAPLQTTDSIAVSQQVRRVKQTNVKAYNPELKNHPYFNFFGKPRYEISSKRSDAGKEGMFYLLAAVVLYFSLVRLLFSKYMNNLFAVFFRVSLKQKQIREQLLQSPLPSLLLNIYFIISGAIYVSFLLKYYHFRGTDNFWYLAINSVFALGLIYLAKFIVLKAIGWIFGVTEATDTYIFIVFLVNKLLGILIVPFLILLAFSASGLTSVLITLSCVMVAIFFIYRYIISYTPVRKEIKVSQFHFILYLCAFEIIPLLLIYKVLLTFLERSS